MNPIERLRMIEEVSQKNFAVKLGYSNKDNYSYNMRNFTEDIIAKIQSVYDRDITMDIINHLKCENRKLKKQLKAQKKKIDSSGLDGPNKKDDIYGILDRD